MGNPATVAVFTSDPAFFCSAPMKWLGMCKHADRNTVLGSRSAALRAITNGTPMNKQERESMIPVSKRKRPEALTNREHQILQLIWSGLTNKEIATRLKISVKTVEAHRATMMKKVRVSNTAQLLKAAIQEGVIQV
jgi:DNA-binding NarL/FixJ family response regulator